MLLQPLIPSRPQRARRGLCCPKSDLGKSELDSGVWQDLALPGPDLSPMIFLSLHILTRSQGHVLPTSPRITISP